VFVLTAAINAPINKKLMTWNASAPPANVMEIWKPWEKVNTIRTVLSMAVFSFEIVALSLGVQPQQIIK